MRKLAPALAAIVVLLAACGGGKPARLTPADVLRHVDPGDVQVFFCAGASAPGCTAAATAAEEHAAESRIARESCVSQSVFVSKELALSWLEKHNPSIAATANSPTGLPLLPDALTVVPTKSSCGTAILTALKAAHLHGVEKIQVVRAGTS